MDRNLRFKINWASLIVGSKFTVFALFYFVFGAIFQVQAPGGERQLNGGFFFALTVWGGLYLEGLIHGGAYFRNFTVVLQLPRTPLDHLVPCCRNNAT